MQKPPTKSIDTTSPLDAPRLLLCSGSDPDLLPRRIQSILAQNSGNLKVSRTQRAAAAGVDRAAYVRFLNNKYSKWSFVSLCRIAYSLNLKLHSIVALAEESLASLGRDWSRRCILNLTLVADFDSEAPKRVEIAIVALVNSIIAERKLSHAEIARQTGFNRSSVHRMSNECHDKSFVFLNAVSKQALGLNFSNLIQRAEALSLVR